MTNETYQNWTKFIVMKIHKYSNILKVISLNYNPYNSCNHFSKCKILCMYMYKSLVLFIVNAPKCNINIIVLHVTKHMPRSNINIDCVQEGNVEKLYPSDPCTWVAFSRTCYGKCIFKFHHIYKSTSAIIYNLHHIFPLNP
jgi:hypothetical protein